MVYNKYTLVLDHLLSYLYGAFCDTFIWCYEGETHCFLLFEKSWARKVALVVSFLFSAVHYARFCVFSTL
uniref:Uncharacterized protein n=1 Tax=Manihot esculenta TaxID=3983 RepID=A0A2C9V6R9_MANES